MKKSFEPCWYRKKSYPHFDMPLSLERTVTYITNPTNIIQHSFLPFISFEIKERRFRKNRRPETKERPIKYAAHLDGNIFSYYAYILSQEYEKVLIRLELSEVVSAYRSGIGNNITFAKEAFDLIEAFQESVAIGFDISSFFDSMDHTRLKHQWATLLGEKKLPDDHYAVFRAITKYSFVDKEKCYERLKYSRKQRKETRPICDSQTFREKIKGRKSSNISLIETNKMPFGIPQGSSISALLANVYMIPFDKEMNLLAKRIGGAYRRYSDDILWVCLPDYEELVKSEVKKLISEMGNQLEINEKKTIVAHFKRNEDNSLYLQDGDKPFQYLGFIFDGKKRLLRSQTLSRYWRKVTFSIKKAKKDASNAAFQQRNGKVFKRKLYRKYTHLGSSNFITYAKRSAIKMSNKLEWKLSPTWKQVKNHWNRLHNELGKNSSS